jgi:hypothetical protein
VMCWMEYILKEHLVIDESSMNYSLRQIVKARLTGGNRPNSATMPTTRYVMRFYLSHNQILQRNFAMPLTKHDCHRRHRMNHKIARMRMMNAIRLTLYYNQEARIWNL